ncbi:SlyX family protein [Primorskyibacter sp. 2E233]|uniref:SlyX family protein n=1 Tax=Primorskyibacter sp. 2E233 TaxID=3413431 RepID=UPI003BF08344
MEHLEERVAHLQRAVDDLSDVIARQDQELSKLKTQVEVLVRREASREQDGTGGAYFADERPPHY